MSSIPKPQKVKATKSELILATIEKKKRKKYTPKNGKKRVNRSVNITTINKEKKLINELSEEYFFSDDEDCNKILLDTTKQVYNLHCFKVATHAWKRSNTRLCFIIACFFYSIKFNNLGKMFNIDKIVKEKNLHLRNIIEFYIIIKKY